MPTNLNFTDRYNSNPAGRIAEPEFYHSPPRAGPSRRPSRKINISDDEARKRAFDEEEFEEPDYPKKSRVEGEELIDGDEDPEWEEYRRIPQRGSKRVLADEDENEDAFLSKRAREKRARKISLENAPLHQSDDMDIDDDEGDDEVPELKSISRGKKRDRTEAGSTFGGDDEDSVHEAEIEDDIKARRRRRKRRTVGKRKSDAGSSLRGKKRDRDVEEGDSDLESLDGELLKVSRKKRGKRLPSTPWQDEDGIGGSDLSMDESQTSSTRGRGRQIGDEWESNGVMFKIGPNGQRLRQALIKKARQKFNMVCFSRCPYLHLLNIYDGSLWTLNIRTGKPISRFVLKHGLLRTNSRGQRPNACWLGKIRPRLPQNPKVRLLMLRFVFALHLYAIHRVMYRLVRIHCHHLLLARTFSGDPGPLLPPHFPTFPHKPHLQVHLPGTWILTASLSPLMLACASIHFNKGRPLGSVSHLEHVLHPSSVVMAFPPVLHPLDLRIAQMAAPVIRCFLNGRNKT